MKIVVFGASGGTGRELVQQGIQAGHEVTAFVRSADSLAGIAPVRIIEGDARKAEDVKPALEGQDACLSALGARDLKTDDLLETAIQHILAGMHEHGVERLVVLGAAGALHNSMRFQTVGRKIMFWAVKATFLRNPFRDAAAQERLIEASSVNYTVVHPPRLTTEPGKNAWREERQGLPPGGMQIARADVAAYMLYVLPKPEYYRTGPYVAN